MVGDLPVRKAGRLPNTARVGEVLDWTIFGLRWLLIALAAFWVFVTLVAESKSPHYAVRGWDFPRLQILCLAAATAVLYLLAAAWGGFSWWDLLVPLTMLGVIGRQAHWVWPYLGSSRRDLKAATDQDAGHPTVRIVISNVLQQNDDYELWRRVMKSQDADIFACAETNEPWVKEIGELLDADYPHHKAVPLDNMYGMAIWSRLPLHDLEVEFIVQEDIPSIHARVELEGGGCIALHVLHPRPPAPQEHDSSSPRDAELIMMAKRIAEERDHDHLPTLVMGDMNDVAWSRTTEIFLRISGLLDPRRGRGLYNSFDANRWYLRFPLDHVFVGQEFRLIDMKRLPYVGSDHFPMRIDLALVPQKQQSNRPQEAEAEDHEEAEEKLAIQANREREGEEDGHALSHPEVRAAEQRVGAR